MITLAQKYAGRASEIFPSIESIPEVTQKLLDRKDEIKKIFKEDRMATLDTGLQTEMTAISILHSANVMKKALDNPVDNENQNRKAFQCIDAYVGLLQGIGIDPVKYLG